MHVGEGIYWRHYDVLLANTCIFQLLKVYCLEVDVRFSFLYGVTFHRESGINELFHYLLPHFKTVLTDARTYCGSALAWIGVVCLHHHGYCLLHNTFHGTLPTCMYGSGNVMLWVINNYRNTVGGTDTYSHASLIAQHCINSLKVRSAFFRRHGKHPFIYDGDAVGVRLVRIYQPRCPNRQCRE